MGNIRISPDVVMRSRVRLARNIVDYPFAPVLNDACRKEIIEKTANVLSKYGYKRIDAENNQLLLAKLSEENKVSREFAAEKEKHALFVNEGQNIYVMVCEEDHLRLQAFSSGLDLSGAGSRILEAEQILSEKIRFAFDNKLGYLTHCPTNLGTAMRASVMMSLPALTLANRMGDLKSQLEKVGVTIRGMYGEGSAADAYIYQISNSLSLGICENDLLSKIETIAIRVAEDEIASRTALFSANTDKLIDKILRSYGTLKYAHMISSAEFLDCYAYVRLGISLGVVKNTDLNDFDKLLSEGMAAHIISKNTKSASDTVLRDKLRAEAIKQRL